jgi:hypothetical protein
MPESFSLLNSAATRRDRWLNGMCFLVARAPVLYTRKDDYEKVNGRTFAGNACWF